MQTDEHMIVGRGCDVPLSLFGNAQGMARRGRRVTVAAAMGETPDLKTSPHPAP
jgi:hypothetical protein